VSKNKNLSDLNFTILRNFGRDLVEAQNMMEPTIERETIGKDGYSDDLTEKDWADIFATQQGIFEDSE